MNKCYDEKYKTAGSILYDFPVLVIPATSLKETSKPEGMKQKKSI